MTTTQKETILCLLNVVPETPRTSIGQKADSSLASFRSLRMVWTDELGREHLVETLPFQIPSNATDWVIFGIQHNSVRVIASSV